MQKIIGGEFEIGANDNDNSSCWGYVNPNRNFQFFSSGRGALFAILQHLKMTKIARRVLLPDYLCSSIVNTVKACGLEFTFYPIDDKLLPVMDFLLNELRPKDAILTINYFGLLKLEGVYKEIRNVEVTATIIEDDVQALACFLKPLPENVDFSFTSLRKWMPVPDGGLTKSRSCVELTTPHEHNTFSQYKLSGLLLKGKREIGISNDSIYLDLLAKGESMIDNNLCSRVSEYTENYFISEFPEEFFNYRKRNSEYLLSGLQDIGFKPIIDVPSTLVPFFIPLWIEDRDKIRREMFKNNIFCPVHWPLDGLKIKKGAEMAKHELSLIIDQRYTFSDMDRILTILTK